eukprot:9139316-Pyramimonas_sp.AAC.1
MRVPLTLNAVRCMCIGSGVEVLRDALVKTQFGSLWCYPDKNREVRDLRQFSRNIGTMFSNVGSTPIPTQVDEWGSCALVGNSGSLSVRPYGNIIDEHEVVMRINQAPVKTSSEDYSRK